jgi:HSP20 family protein
MARLSLFNPLQFDRGLDNIWDMSLMDYPENNLDLYEEGDEVVLKLKAPGFKEDELETTIASGVVTITGKKSADEEVKDKDRKYYRREISTQSFTRKVDLPVAIDANKAEADYEDGVLVLRIPKSEEAKAKKIKVRKKIKK